MKKFISQVNYLVAALVAVVINLVNVACSDDYDLKEQVVENRQLIPASKPATVPTLSFTFQRTDSTATEKTLSTEWISSETTTGTKVYGELNVATSHEDGNAVLEAEMNKVVDLSYAQKHTTYGELKSYSQSYGGTMRGTYAMRIVAQLGDQGTMCYLDAENVIEKALVRDTLRFFPADSIEFGKAQVKSLRFVEKSVTRAATEYVDKNDPRYVEVTWTVPVKRVHDKVNLSYNVEVKDNVVVFPIKKNDIVNVETDTLRILVDPTIVNCIVKHNFTYKNGEKGKSEKSATIKCSLTAKPEWTVNVSNTSFNFVEAERVKYGTPYTPAGMEQEGCYFLERVDEFTVVNGNGTELIKNPYTFTHQSVTIKDEFGVYEFNFVNPDFRQVSTNVVKVSETSTLETARLFNTIEVSYLGGRQMGEETVLLKRTIDEYVISTKLDNLSAMTTVTSDSIIWSIDKLTKYSTDRETRQSVRFGISRKLVLGAAWTSIQDNTNHQTGDYVPSLNNSYKRSATVDGVTFSYTLREKVYTSNVVLNDGKAMKNTFTATEGEDCVAQLGNSTCSFGNQAVSVNHSDNVAGGAEKDGYKVYNYTDKVNYTFGSNTKSFNLNGTIKVKAEEEFSFPYGEVKLARQTTTLNEAGDDYMYVISVQFMNGVVVPGFVTRGSDKVVWHLELAEQVEGSNKFNSAVYTSEGWKNCTAHDVYTADYLIWYRGTTELRRVDFNKAAELHWDNDYLREDNGKNHLTVYTSHFRLEIAKGKLYVTDKDSGTPLKFVKF